MRRQPDYDYTLVSNHLLHHILEDIHAMTVQLDQLTSEVEENTSVTESAVALLANLAEQLRANADDPAAIEDLANKLDTNSNRLADAVAANTPAE